MITKGGYVFGISGQSVRLSVCEQHYSKCYEQIAMKFCAGVLGCTIKNWLKFDGDLGLLRWVNEQTKLNISCSIPDWGADKDQEALGLAFHHQGPTTFINAYCQGNAKGENYCRYLKYKRKHEYNYS